ncbi:hypothetical protein DSM112329_02430 [Paraconexibacter sp. AEG42_29]|uniref:Glycosyltransferase 2-like domain-containing protein n=1 Tax=Paraconexibacter sp. AEG42_29 TaxID=2997339 RepID=A0AAU7AVS6_9ACTN
MLVTLHGGPLGFVDVDLIEGRCDGADLHALARERFANEVTAHLASDGTPIAGPGDPITWPSGAPACVQSGAHGEAGGHATVVVCTRDREASLRRTLLLILELDYPQFDVVVVDNAPRTDAARRVIAELDDARLSYVLEPVSGLSRARNCGLAHASGSIIAFTDDDVLVDRQWLAALARGFTRAPRVGCVTGIVPGAERETLAQAYFEARVQWSDRMQPALHDLGRHRPADDPFFPYSAGRFGTGANFAVSRAAADDIGTFDEALGPGVPATNADDLDYFLRTILGGWTLAYEPRAVAWHVHRREMTELEAQMRTYGKGLSAYAFKHLRTRRAIVQILPRLPRAARILLTRARSAESIDPAAAGLVRLELRGMLGGPWGYVQGRRAVRARARRER